MARDLSTPKRASTLSDAQQARVRSLLEPLCTPHADPKVRAKLQYGYRFEGPAVVFFERRPHFETGEWAEEDIAKFRYTKRTGLWSLSCQFRDLKWRAYEPLPFSDDLAELVEELERDPTCIFFG
jgi:hypothetical protein